MDFIDERFDAWWKAGILAVPGSHEDIARQAFRAGVYLGVYQPRPAAEAAADAEVPLVGRAEAYLRKGRVK